MGLPLGANGILTIPYINLASQNLNAAFFSFQKKFCWVSLTSNHDKLSAFILYVCIPEFSLVIFEGTLPNAIAMLVLQLQFFECFGSMQNQQAPAIVHHCADFTFHSQLLVAKILFAKNTVCKKF